MNLNSPYMMEHVDYYCERTGPEFWSEPINALTNISFIIASLVIFYLYKKEKQKDVSILILGIMSMSVGIGSFIFHTLAIRWASLFDLLPIAIFSTYLVYLSARRSRGLSIGKSLIFLFGFFMFLGITMKFAPMNILSGSLMYVPVILTVIYFAKYGKNNNKYFKLGAFFFILSIIFRTLDSYMVGHFELGTHFLWHTFNGLTFFFLMRAVMKQPKTVK